MYNLERLRSCIHNNSTVSTQGVILFKKPENGESKPFPRHEFSLEQEPVIFSIGFPSLLDLAKYCMQHGYRYEKNAVFYIPDFGNCHVRVNRRLRKRKLDEYIAISFICIDNEFFPLSHMNTTLSPEGNIFQFSFPETWGEIVEPFSHRNMELYKRSHEIQQQKLLRVSMNFAQDTGERHSIKLG